MCTVTIFKSSGRTILTMNRDEGKYRHEAEMLSISEENVYPIDPSSNGTWVGCNRYGISAALLNNYQAVHNQEPVHSRGIIIPELMKFNNLEKIEFHLKKIDWRLYAGFNLIVTDGRQILRGNWDGVAFILTYHDLDIPYFITSSSEEIIEYSKFREDQFRKFYEKYHSTDQQISALDILKKLHLSTDKKTERADIFMLREMVHTKSVTQICMDETQTDLNYWPESVIVKRPLELQQEDALTAKFDYIAKIAAA